METNTQIGQREITGEELRSELINYHCTEKWHTVLTLEGHIFVTDGAKHLFDRTGAWHLVGTIDHLWRQMVRFGKWKAPGAEFTIFQIDTTDTTHPDGDSLTITGALDFSDGDPIGHTIKVTMPRTIRDATVPQGMRFGLYLHCGTLMLKSEY